MHEGNPLSTSSNDACKMYDAALSQIVGWYNDPNLGGLDQTFKLMEREDSDFVMGRCLKICSLLADTGRHPKNDPYLRCQLLTLNRLSQEGAKRLSQRERLHVKAVNEWADGNMKAAANVWERILLDNPTDMHAIRFSQDVYFFTGQQMRLRDSIARVLPFWQSSSIPLKK